MKSNLIEFAMRNYGVHETPDPNTANPKVLQFFADAGGSWVKDDTNYAWCAAFMNSACKNCGLPTTGSLLAASFLEAGQPTNAPEIGDVVVFQHESPHVSHVSMFVRHDDDGESVWVLGGNQSDAVNVSKYNKAYVAGYRDVTKPWPKFQLTLDLKEGSNNADVGHLQAFLRIAADNEFGPATEAALKVFQSSHGLKADGQVGPLTRAVINKLT